MNKKFSSIFTIGVFITYVCFSFFLNYDTLRDKFIKAKTDNTKNEIVDYKQTFIDFDSAFSSNLKEKYEYITLNGGFANLLGEKELNGVVKVGGTLHDYEKDGNDNNVNKSIENIIAFEDWLFERSIPFLYVQAPNKISPSGEELESWMSNNVNNKASKLIYSLQDENINNLDLRVLMENAEISFEDAFYKTDHHWKTETAFWAVPYILGKISEITDMEVDYFYTEEDNWNIKTFENIFLGHRGKRVGTLFGGELDDFKMYLPKFETDIVLERPKNNINNTGNFNNVFINKTQFDIENLIHYFTKSAYYIYGSDYAYEIISNNLAYNDKKILILDDSFGVPTTKFLYNHFAEMHLIDLRYDIDTKELLEIIESVQPDIVMMLFYPGTIQSHSTALNVNPNNI